MTTTTFCDYFKLLMWKNSLIKLRHKKEFIIEIVVPLLFCSLLVLIRSFIGPAYKNQATVFKSVEIDNLDYFQNREPDTKWEVVYTPANQLYDKLVYDAVSEFKLTTKGFDSGLELEAYMLANNSFCGIVFDTSEPSSKILPKKLAYSLRFPAILRGTYGANWVTEKLVPVKFFQGPRNKFYDDGGYSPGYIEQGFITVQNAITKSFINLSAQESGKTTVKLPDIVMERFPYPPYMSDDMLTVLESLAPFIFVLSFIYPVNQIVKHVTSEKENQLKETMKIMGLKTVHHWTAWFATMFIWMAILILVMVGLLKIPLVQGTAVFPATSWTLLFIFLLIYSIATITFCFMISSFFQKAGVAGTVSGLIWFLSYFPYSFTIDDFIQLNVSSKMVFSLLLNTALGFGFKAITRAEGLGSGAGWSNFFNRSNLDNSLSLGQVIVMLILDTVLYMLITLYVEKVLPGSSGVAYKWYFPFTKDFWCPQKVSSEFFDDVRRNSILDPDCFELDPANESKEAGIRIRNLTKIFNGKTAVDDLNLDMYKNEIIVLLGHNGAGKTTSISMITGFLRPTKGTIVVNGLDISNNMAVVRKHLGICPQHNILFNELTVREHIIFYSRLKGFERSQIEAEVDKYLGILKLEDKRDALSSTLSGGMKRKLSLGVSLCGDSKVVLCDEPSSGMDPQARRALWDLLESEKKGRTILLTTHFMDEADVLGDRIAIMSSGKLVCCGTSFFLKKKFGTGYQLICSKHPECRSEKVTALIRKYIPDVEVKTDVGSELSYSLADSYAPKFEFLLKDLEDSQAELRLNGYGISMTTLEDVFMRTGSEINVAASEKDEIINRDTSILVDSKNSNGTVSGIQLYQYQFYAMFMKKTIYYYRHWFTFLMQMLIPVILLIISLQSASSETIIMNLPPLPITLDSYGHTATLLSIFNTSNSLDVAQNYRDMFKEMSNMHTIISTERLMQDEILALGREPLGFSEKTKYMVAATVTSNRITAWFNNEALHTPPLALNLVQNAIAKSLLGSEYGISITNEPLPFDVDYKLQQARSGTDIGIRIAFNIAFSMSFVSAIFVMFLIKERESRAKLMQFASGINSVIFWTTHLLFDMIVNIFIMLLVVLIMFVYQQHGFRTSDELGRIVVIYLLYGFASLPFTYLVSFLFTNPSTGLSRVSTINIFTGIALYTVIFALKGIDGENPKVATAEDILLIIPNFAFVAALSSQVMSASNSEICESMRNRFGYTREEACNEFGATCCNMNPYAWNFPGIGKVLVFLFCNGVFYFVVLLLIERYFRSLWNIKNLFRPELPKLKPDIDDDVQLEKDRVSTMPDSEIADKILVMRGLTKYYKKFLAVNQLSLSIEHGECFGLLGINGAGKTSAFKMLAGDEHISYGDVYIKGYNTKQSMSKIFEMIGYCPQFDALLLELTGRETLKIFSLIRGIPIQTIDSHITRLGKDLAFERSLNKKVAAYSGGNRRKLSTAVALLGNPQVVYLDEPTAGIDPASRRKLWDMICFVRDLGKGIVLTSHSMEECEALCTRIAIMVNGEFRCLGSTQHLKDKFSKGITLTVKMKKAENDDGDQEVDECSQFSEPIEIDLEIDKYEQRVCKFICNQIPRATLKDSRPRLLTFEIPLNILPYSKIFGLMEANKQALCIEDYSLTQATLEQVFLKFAGEQRNEEEKSAKKGSKNRYQES